MATGQMGNNTQTDRCNQPKGSPNDSWAEPVWPAEQTNPTKADHRRWQAQDAWQPVVNEANIQNMAWDWVARAAQENLCVVCGAPGAPCEARGNCGPAIHELHARQRAQTNVAGGA